jgi:hypothetical protein
MKKNKRTRMLELILLSMSRIREKKLWESYNKLFVI